MEHLLLASKFNEEHYDRLRQRMCWLEQRIIAKKKVGWETGYDESEFNSLKSALPELQKCFAPKSTANS